jgi:hypothetical protein
MYPPAALPLKSDGMAFNQHEIFEMSLFVLFDNKKKAGPGAGSMRSKRHPILLLFLSDRALARRHF